MPYSIAQRRSKLIFDISNSVIVRERGNPYTVRVRTKHGNEHVITFCGSLEEAQVAKKRFIAEFYLLRKNFVPRRKLSGQDLKFLDKEI